MARALKVAYETIKRSEQRIKELQSENEQREQVISLQGEQLAKDASKVEYYEQTLAAENMLTAQQIANELHISARELNKKLADTGVIFYKSNQWMGICQEKAKAERIHKRMGRLLSPCRYEVSLTCNRRMAKA